MSSDFDGLNEERVDRAFAKIGKSSSKQKILSSGSSVHCIDENKLQDYTENIISIEERIEIEEHLGNCDLCFTRFMISRDMLYEPLIEAPFRLKQRIKEIVPQKKENIFNFVLSFTRNTIRIIKNSGNFLLPEVGLQPVRGIQGAELERQGDFISLGKRIKNIDVNLQLERIDDSLKLMIHTIDSKTQKSPANVRLMLCSEERELNSVKESEAVFYLKFKKYFIKIFVHGKQIGVINLGLTKEY